MNTQSIFRTAAAAMLLTSSLLFTQCQGPQGEPGPQGEKGATGSKGETGTTNVIYSGWVNMSNNSFWSSHSDGFTANFAAPPINQTVIDQGLVLIYVKDGDRNNVFQLPLYINTNLTIKAYATLQRIHLILQVNPSAGVTSFSNFLLGQYTTYRYIVVPGGMAGGRKATVDYSNYEEVKAYYNLPD